MGVPTVTKLLSNVQYSHVDNSLSLATTTSHMDSGGMYTTQKQCMCVVYNNPQWIK